MRQKIKKGKECFFEFQIYLYSDYNMTDKFNQENVKVLEGLFEGVWLNLENYSKSKEVLLNKWENLTALSNRRLTLQTLKFFDPNEVISTEISSIWSIDRLTIVGKITPPDFRRVDEVTGEILGTVSPFDDKLDEIAMKGHLQKVPSGWQIVDRYGENIAFIGRVPFQGDKARIDFNPNKLAYRDEQFMRELIHAMFDEPYFSRADLACDILGANNDYMRSYGLAKPVSVRTYEGIDGKVETKYFGSSSSEMQVRLYDKMREQLKKGQPLPVEIKTWWRLEFQLRRGKANDFGNTIPDTLSVFVNQNCIPDSLKVTDQVMLAGLLHQRGLWSKLAPATKAKYKKYVKLMATEHDEVNKFILETYFEEVDRLKNQLGTWLRMFNVSDNLDDE